MVNPWLRNLKMSANVLTQNGSTRQGCKQLPYSRTTLTTNRAANCRSTCTLTAWPACMLRRSAPGTVPVYGVAWARVCRRLRRGELLLCCANTALVRPIAHVDASDISRSNSGSMGTDIVAGCVPVGSVQAPTTTWTLDVHGVDASASGD